MSAAIRANQSVRAQVIGLAGWLLLTFAAAAAGAFASASAGTFYQQLSRPDWSPPAWLFGPVWTVLYIMMAVAAWLVWRRHGFRRAGGALTIYILQLVINALWTWLFFVWHQGQLAFVEILILWALIVVTMAAFARQHALAALLLVPYLGWVSFACALTFVTWQSNPAILG
ncbi:MAG: tryptophan-rich sensory protein [Burkholderiaceae bacterium]|nr:tryptophan-rich sensory protein [Burkholderiaceae bacterium]